MKLEFLVRISKPEDAEQPKAAFEARSAYVWGSSTIEEQKYSICSERKKVNLGAKYLSFEFGEMLKVEVIG